MTIVQALTRYVSKHYKALYLQVPKKLLKYRGYFVFSARLKSVPRRSSLARILTQFRIGVLTFKHQDVQHNNNVRHNREIYSRVPARVDGGAALKGYRAVTEIDYVGAHFY